MGPMQREVILNSLFSKVSVVNFTKCLHTSAKTRGYYDPSDSCKLYTDSNLFHCLFRDNKTQLIVRASSC